MTDKEFGQAGENFCADFYRKNGYKILSQNYHCRYGELDVVAQKDDLLVIIEVKTRKLGTMLDARDAVDKRKQKKIMLSTLSFAATLDNEYNIRFDIFEVLHNGERLCNYRVNESAFDFDEDLLKDTYY